MRNAGKRVGSSARTPRRSRKRLLLVVVAVVLLVAGTYHIVHGSGSSRPAHRPTATHFRPSAACRHARSTTLRHRCALAARRASSQTVRHHWSAMHRYAVLLLPLLDRSNGVFNHAANGAAASPVSTLGDICNRYGNSITILSERADGVPHPSAWYDPVASLHRSVMGVYHNMQGALLNCATAAENSDSNAASLAQGDLGNGARQMAQLDRQIRRLTRKP